MSNRICADEDIKVFIVDPHAISDFVYRCRHADEEIDGWPVEDKKNCLPEMH